MVATLVEFLIRRLAAIERIRSDGFPIRHIRFSTTRHTKMTKGLGYWAEVSSLYDFDGFVLWRCVTALGIGPRVAAVVPDGHVALGWVAIGTMAATLAGILIRRLFAIERIRSDSFPIRYRCASPGSCRNRPAAGEAGLRILVALFRIR